MGHECHAAHRAAARSAGSECSPAFARHRYGARSGEVSP
jgi:hypothetical protein